MNEIHDLVIDNRILMGLVLADAVSILSEGVHNTLEKNVYMQELFAKWVP